MAPTIRPATTADLPAIHPVIERAYRGETARQGWTHEADLIEGPRTDLPTLNAIVEDPAQVLLGAWEGETAIGCVNVANRGGGTAYLGLLCIDPLRQDAGLGRQLIAAAEAHARTVLDCTRMEMTVIEQRRKLIDYYVRRGYAETGARCDFPIPLDPPLFMTVLAKKLV
ncbi:GNAT family N-acetyltransferase [Sphingomonas sp. ABOLD]|jgi:GNAT superfamily N-acetyltransferase|uniref:GNAT superfamily N-acetyltransferase n=1 Tax=Sphingomonas trueperi TaxID=53317 RepID=A0A7X5XXV1_9SPHN|nr:MULTISPECIES: GNAT family N-acetyltransferase [Sphingomonas]NJB97344.1 GNAT superfamily N-acetyltransferase [Sphingomonas trueperi]RSV38065.1 GNAT family N-acetyltransferase [Sphingomonas sp. ABOLE]RSV41878.1 GNAT family N-acetyltransferase [Sphingomonas sp. ABOLD]